MSDRRSFGEGAWQCARRASAKHAVPANVQLRPARHPGVSGGIAIGHAHLICHATARGRRTIAFRRSSSTHESRALRHARSRRCATSSSALRAHSAGDRAAEFVGFIDVHLMILNDSTLSDAPQGNHRQRAVQRRVGARSSDGRAARAVRSRSKTAICASARATCVQVVERVHEGAARAPGLHACRQRSDGRRLILVAHDLSPADVIQFKQHHFASFITDLGGATSHTAIVARSLNIPSIVALHHARQLIREDELAHRRRHAGRRHRRSRQAGARRVSAAAGAVRPRAAEAQTPARPRAPTTLDGTRSSSTRTSSCPRTSRRRKENGATRHRPVSQRIPVPEPRASCLPKTSSSRPTGAWREEMDGLPGDDPHLRSRVPTRTLDGAQRFITEPGAGAAGDPPCLIDPSAS